MRSPKLVLDITLNVTQRSYATSAIPVDEFKALEHYHDELYEHGGQSLMDALKALGCENIEWNGHFGPHVYFALAADDDTAQKRGQVLRTIKSYVSRATRWAAKQKAVR